LHPIGYRIARRQHDNGHIRCSADALGDFKAIYFGEHDIQDDDIGWSFARCNQRCLSVCCGFDRIAFEAQSSAQIPSNLGFVFDDQNALL